jgi:hypothetical protein
MHQTLILPSRRRYLHRFLCIFLLTFPMAALGQYDPGPDPGGPRSGFNDLPSTGDPLHNLTGGESAAFNAGKLTFQEVDSVTGTLTSGSGLGPRFNMDSCSGCHAYPTTGGSSPPVNPQVAVATKAGATNSVPAFLSAAGPVREARLLPAVISLNPTSPPK